jgi:hypothetical protein
MDERWSVTLKNGPFSGSVSSATANLGGENAILRDEDKELRRLEMGGLGIFVGAEPWSRERRGRNVCIASDGKSG